ncbi:MAG: LytTR family DNA-binding domain-containing protein [Allomuricauda sp.]
MSKQISLITLFVLLNMGIGRMFQESLGATCFSELSILAVTSFFFWNISAKPIKAWASKWSLAQDSKSLMIQGSLGLSASALNIIIGQALVVFLMTTVYQCSFPTFNLLHASLTNNVAVNLLCYFSLLFYFVNTGENSTHESPGLSEKLDNTSIHVSKGGTKFLLHTEEIIYVAASNNCIVLHTERGRFVKYQSLKSFAKTICPTTFKRVHRSHLVNAAFIDCIQKNNSGDGTLYLKSGDTIKFSRTYLKALGSI